MREQKHYLNIVLTQLEDDRVGKQNWNLIRLLLDLEYSEYDCFKDIQEDYDDLETIEDFENKTSDFKNG